MEVCDLPLGSGATQLIVDPLKLRGVHVVAIQDEELSVTLFERVITLAIHIEGLIPGLVGVIMISQAGVELDTSVEEGLVRSFKFQLKVSGLVPSVDVVAHHGHEVVADYFAVSLHLRRHLVFCRLAGAVISNHRETNRFLFERELNVNLGLPDGNGLLKRQSLSSVRAWAQRDRAACQ